MGYHELVRKSLKAAALSMAIACVASTTTTQAEAAGYRCGIAKNTYEMKGASGILARHILDIKWCWNGSQVKDAEVADHDAEEVGATGLFSDVTVKGEPRIVKVGSSYHVTAHAVARTCVIPILGGKLCYDDKSTISLKLKSNGKFDRKYSGW